MERKSNVFDRVLAALMIVVMLFSNGGAGLSVFAEELLDQVALEAQADASVEGELSDESRDIVAENTSTDGSNGSDVDSSQSANSLTGEVSENHQPERMDCIGCLCGSIGRCTCVGIFRIGLCKGSGLWCLQGRQDIQFSHHGGRR